jgi:hypothetical protein
VRRRAASCGASTINFLDARHGYALAWWAQLPEIVTPRLERYFVP